MILPEGLEAEFWQEFKQFEEQCVARVPRVVATAEREKKMSYMTTGEVLAASRENSKEILKENRDLSYGYCKDG